MVSSLYRNTLSISEIIYTISVLDNLCTTMVIILATLLTYCIQPNYRIYPYKHTVKQFRSLQITASELFVYSFTKRYVMGTYLNCIDKSIQFK